MKENADTERTSRRTVLKTFASTAVAFPILGQNPPQENRSSIPVTKQGAAEHHYRYFRPEQLNTLDALTETIIPTDEHSPGAKAAGVSEYIDAIVADAPESTRDLWSNGLVIANQMAQNSFGKPYADCSAEEQIALLSVLAGNERQPSSTEKKFFAALKQATINGYYTSKIGIHQDLQYQGNQALNAFPGCQHPDS